MIVGQVNLKPMGSSFQTIGEISSTTDYQYLCVLFQNLIKDVEFYRDQLNLNGNSIAARRETDSTRKKIEIVNETLSSLNFIKTHLEETVNVIVPISYPSSRGPSDEYADFGVLSLLTETLIGKFKSFTSRKLRECITQLDSLDSGHKSPYNFSSIINELLKSLEKNSNPDSQIQVESLLKLAQSELQFIMQSKDMNDGQLTLIKIYCDKLNLLYDELSSIDKETENKAKQKAKKLRDIVNGTRLIIKETFELIVALKTIDWINESDEIFAIINEKGTDSFDDVIDYMEKIKKHWIEFKTVNGTSKVCRLAALRRFNVYIKQMKKLSMIKSELESDWIILGIKNITNNFNRIERSSLWVRKSAHWLTYKNMPKPTVNVPDGFIRDDLIYEELNSNQHQHVLIILIHIIRYLHYLSLSTWNKFQIRKPGKVCYDFIDMFFVIESSIASDFNDDELHSISLDLADRLCLAKIKIANDRDALEYRLFRYKPKKPHKFPELQKILQIKHSKKYSKAFYYFKENLDEILNGFNRKVTNRGQMMIMESGMEMMKRSWRTLKLFRYEAYRTGEDFLMDYIVNQASNEFCYVIETLGTLLDNFRPNRRIPFSFSADGKFTKQINEIGLGMKKDFEMEINSQIEKLKATIKENEENLESTKEEKIQLRYLTSIVKRSKLIPIKEIELSEKEEIEILREIIEEYEYTLILYGPID